MKQSLVKTPAFIQRIDDATGETGIESALQEIADLIPENWTV